MWRGKPDQKKSNQAREPAARADWRGKSRPAPAPHQPPSRSWLDFGQSQSDGKTAHRIKLAAATLVLCALVGAFVWYLLGRGDQLPLIAGAVTGYDEHTPPNSFAVEDLERLTVTNTKNIEFFDERVGFAGREEFLAAVAGRLQRTAPGGPDRNVVVLFVSAHGALNDQGQACLLLADADPWDSRTWLSFDDFLKYLDENGGKGWSSKHHRVLVLDGARIASDARLGVLYNGFPAAVTRHIAQLDATRGKNLHVLLSADAGQRSFPAPEFGGSAFGYYLARGLAGLDGADADGRNGVTLRELHAYLRLRLSAWAKQHRDAVQQPVLVPAEGSDFSLTFVKTDEPPPTAAPAVPGDDGLAALGGLWARHQTLQMRQPPPWRFDPAGWSMAEEKLLRAEALLWAGSAYREEFLGARSEADVLLKALEGLPRPASDAHAASLPMALQFGELSAQDVERLAAELNQPPPTPADAAVASAPPPPPPPPPALDATYLAWRRFASPERPPLTEPRLQDAVARLSASAPRGLASRPAPPPIEAHYLKMLAGHIDWGVRPVNRLEQVVQRSIQARDAAEHAAAPSDERAHYWIQAIVDQADARRRQAEDKLFLGASTDVGNALNDADRTFAAVVDDGADSYAAAQRLGERVSESLRLRDEVWTKAPHFACWTLARQRRRLEGGAAPEDSTAAVVQLVAQAHAFGARLEDPGREGDLEALMGALRASLEKLHRAFDSQAVAWDRETNLDARVLAEIENEALATPLVSGARRERLLNKYRDILLALAPPESSPSQTPGPAPPPAADAANDEHAHKYLEWLAGLPLHPELAILDRAELELPGVKLSALDRQRLTLPKVDGADLARLRAVHIDRLAQQGAEMRRMLRTAAEDAQSLMKDTERRFHEEPTAPPVVVRLGAEKADRLLRAAAPRLAVRIGSSEADDPTRTLRGLDHHYECLWHAFRALEDGWGSGVENDVNAYFAGVVEEYFRGARRVGKKVYLGQNLAELLELRQVAARAGIVPAPQTAPTADPQEARRQTIALTVPPHFPPGEAAIYVRGSELLPLGLEGDRTVRRRGVAISSTGGPRSLAPHRLNAEDLRGATHLEVVAFYRGHVRVARDPLPVIGPVTELAIVPRTPGPPKVTVHPDPSLVQSVMFVLDCSGSMDSPLTGASVKRMDAAIATFRQILAGLPNGKYRIGLMLYGHRASGNAVGRITRRNDWINPVPANLHPNEDVEIVVPLGDVAQTRQQIGNVLNNVLPVGFTPLYFSIREALAVMQNTPTPRRLVVITDGLDFKYQDSTAPARANVSKDDVLASLQRGGDPKIAIDLVALDMAAVAAENRSAFEELKAIANASGGTLHDAKDANGLLQALNAALNPFQFSVSKKAGPPDSQRLKLGETRVVEPRPLQPEPFTVEVTAQPPIAAEVILEGGEALEMFLTKSRLVHQRFDPPHLPVVAKRENVVDPDDPSRKFFIGGHLVVDKEGTNRLFRVSVQNQDETRFTPRPQHLWAEIRPDPPTADGRTYPFFDLDFEEDRPVPVLRFAIGDWPLAAQQATLRLWLRYGAVNEKKMSLDQALARPFEVSELAGIRFQARTIPATDGGDLHVIVSEEHSPGGDIFRTRVQMTPTPDRIRHRYSIDAHRVEHLFSYANPRRLELTAPQIHIASREELQRRAIAVEEPPLRFIVGKQE